MDTSTQIAALEAAVATLTARLDELETKKAKRGERDYGPDSTRAMDDRGALRILIGRYRDWSVRKIADECGYSRGQIYSLKGRYTMKSAWKTADAITASRLERSLIPTDDVEIAEIAKQIS